MVDTSISPTTATGYKDAAYTATNTAGDLATSAPTLLSQLKQNLVGIFAKDNPIINARNDALSGYLSTASQSRADVLPGNMPTVEGRALTLSPTQQDAITSARLSSSLAPLAGYNEILKGMYGNIGDLVSGAGGIYQSTISAADKRAQNLIDLYKTAVTQEKDKASGGLGLDLASILSALRGETGTQAPTLQDPNAIADSIYGGQPNQQPSQKFTLPAVNNDIQLGGSATKTGLPWLDSPAVNLSGVNLNANPYLSGPSTSGISLSSGGGNPFNGINLGGLRF